MVECDFKINLNDVNLGPLTFQSTIQRSGYLHFRQIHLNPVNHSSVYGYIHSITSFPMNLPPG